MQTAICVLERVRDDLGKLDSLSVSISWLLGLALVHFSFVWLNQSCEPVSTPLGNIRPANLAPSAARLWGLLYPSFLSLSCEAIQNSCKWSKRERFVQRMVTKTACKSFQMFSESETARDVSGFEVFVMVYRPFWLQFCAQSARFCSIRRSFELASQGRLRKLGCSWATFVQIHSALSTM